MGGGVATAKEIIFTHVGNTENMSSILADKMDQHKPQPWGLQRCQQSTGDPGTEPRIHVGGTHGGRRGVKGWKEQKWSSMELTPTYTQLPKLPKQKIKSSPLLFNPRQKIYIFFCLVNKQTDRQSKEKCGMYKSAPGLKYTTHTCRHTMNDSDENRYKLETRRIFVKPWN